ncbi:MAG: tryptophan 2,3-dioxygenase family protein [Phycisphaerales bacterium]|nr:tryptophan 2,3-dioxygenase family protein [Phycisphaerales bacterium]
MSSKEKTPVYYSEYLQLEKILNAQILESSKAGIKADDEMLFIIIHQSYELWFKLVLHEIDIVANIFRQSEIPNNSPDIFNAVHRIKRVCKILELCVHKMSIIETMTPLDFLDFRDLLRPASGFQSIQFKIIEAKLGLAYDNRFGKSYYLSQLNTKDIEQVKQAESDESLLVLINRWLERMPFTEDKKYWQELGVESFWDIYSIAYAESLNEHEKGNITTFNKLFINPEEYPKDRSFSMVANRSALFIMLYRDYPMLHLPFELVSSLLEIDQLLSMWRHRHIHMVQRTIGKRVGTGGSTGADYLKSAADSHYIFKEMAELTSFLLPRNLLPSLPQPLQKDLRFTH